jgi:hypothetical protein
VNKIPVGKTIGFAYDFAFNQIGTVIGLIWVPMVAIGVLQFMPSLLGDTMVPPDQVAAAGAAALRNIGFGLLTMLLYAGIYVSVTRQALGLRKGPAAIYFMLGQAEFRMWGALLLMGLLFVVFAMIFLIAVVSLTALAGSTGNNPGVGLLLLAVIVGGSCALIFVLVRLSFLLAPVTVAEGKISFERVWILSRGNFWRIFVVMLGVGFPILIVYLAASYAIMGNELVALVMQAPKLSQVVLNNRLQAILQGHISATIGLGLLLAPFTVGLSRAAAAAGYLALTGAPRNPVEASAVHS